MNFARGQKAEKREMHHPKYKVVYELYEKYDVASLCSRDGAIRPVKQEVVKVSESKAFVPRSLILLSLYQAIVSTSRGVGKDRKASLGLFSAASKV